jgi:hypothetical protein
MSHKEIGLLLIGLVLVEGMIAIILGHGLNGRYFRESKSQGEAYRKLRADKPVTATVIGVCWLAIVIELVIGLLHNLGKN